jgi:O-antigen/teichoic acid export membrane protein
MTETTAPASASTLNVQKATLQGTFWNYVSFFGGKSVVLLSTFVLARLLSQEDYGVAGYAFTIISFIEIVSDLGVSAALIYHREDPLAPHTAFWLVLGIGALLGAGLWLVAPLVGIYFQDERAVAVTQVLGLQFAITALGDTHKTQLQKSLSFKRKVISDLTQSLGKAAITITLALLHFGPWSLIGGQLGSYLIGAMTLWVIFPWRPQFRFSPPLAHSMLTYGSKFALTNIVGITLLNVDYLLVGRFLGPVALGTYTLAFRLPDLLIRELCSVLGKVIFPIYAKVRDNPEALRRGMLDTTRYVALVTMPLGLGLAIVADPLTRVLFTAKWEAAIPVMRWIALYALFTSLAFNSGDVFKAQGRMAILTYLSLGKLALLVPGLWWVVAQPTSDPLQLLAPVGAVQAGVALIGNAVNLYLAARLLHASLGEVVAALRPAFVGGAVMSLVTIGALLGLASAEPLAQLIGSVLAGGLTYLAVVGWLERDLVQRLWGKARARLAKRKAQA